MTDFPKTSFYLITQKLETAEFPQVLTSPALEVDGIEVESTTPSSSTERFEDASALLESDKLADSRNCFLTGCLLLLPDVNICPLMFLISPAISS